MSDLPSSQGETKTFPGVIFTQDIYRYARFSIYTKHEQVVEGKAQISRYAGIRNMEFSSLVNVEACHFKINGMKIFTGKIDGDKVTFPQVTGSNVLMPSFFPYCAMEIVLVPKDGNKPASAKFCYEFLLFLFPKTGIWSNLHELNVVYQDLGMLDFTDLPENIYLNEPDDKCHLYLQMQNGIAGCTAEMPVSSGFRKSNAWVATPTGKMNCNIYVHHNFIDKIHKDEKLREIATVSDMIGLTSHGPILLATESPEECKKYIEATYMDCGKVTFDIRGNETIVDEEATLATRTKEDEVNSIFFKNLCREIHENVNTPVEFSDVAELTPELREEFEKLRLMELEFLNNKKEHASVAFFN